MNSKQDNDFVEFWYRQYSTYLFRYACLFVDSHTAEEVVQETFRIVCEKGPLDQIEHPKTWLRKIAVGGLAAKAVPIRTASLCAGHHPHLRGGPCPAAGGRSVVHDCRRRTMPRPAGGYPAYRKLRLQGRTLRTAALYRWTGGKSTGQFLPHRRGDLPYPLACLQGASSPAACRACRVGDALPWAEKGRKTSAVSPPCRVPQRRRATEALPRPSPL